ncbi:MAG: S-adenosylmethionine:tRNA ribosyltransferase-isomerase [Pseudonocardiales bacterium]
MTPCLQCSPSLSFELPEELAAAGPPERRGVPRDGVRMLVASAAEGLRHAHARDLPDALRPGDLAVLNTSETLPAALAGLTGDGEPVAVHLSTVLPGSGRTPSAALAATSSPWVVELRRSLPSGSEPSYADRSGAVITVAGRARVDVRRSHPAGAARSRLWVADVRTPRPLGEWLGQYGEPIRYSHIRGRWPISAYRTAYGDVPGSAEMPSAGRPLTTALIRRLRQRGVEVRSLVLHCGVSSLEGGDPPHAEWFSLPSSTAVAVNRARGQGRRVVAVGTTVVRALESAVDSSGGVQAGQGWTDLVITPDRGVAVVDGLLTGWHEPAASHLWMLAALAGSALLCDSYRSALEHGYRWHEFGDVHLLLP